LPPAASPWSTSRLTPAKALPALIKEPAKGKFLRSRASLVDLTGSR
jgi:hypothetical protein